MRDHRIDALARTLVRYSTELKVGETVLIQGPELSQPLALAVYREALEVGAHPILWSTFDEAASVFFSNAGEAQLGWSNPILVEAARAVDAYVSLRAPTNTRMLAAVDPAKQVVATKARQPFLDVVLQKRWVLCELPTPALAQDAGMSLAEFEDFSFGAVMVDWPAMRAELQRRKKQLEAGRDVRIVGTNTDLRLGVAGRTWLADDGKHNMPGGEIFTGPIEDSVEGEIAYEYPAVYNGRDVEGVRLRFKGGHVVDASATRGEDFLVKMLDADPGARVLGELGIGTNFGITRHSKSVLFDEKIGGTVHLALGRSYEQSGGTNVSSVHWDMVKDLRNDGEIQMDGRTIQKNGRWVD